MNFEISDIWKVAMGTQTLNLHEVVGKKTLIFRTNGMLMVNYHGKIRKQSPTKQTKV